MEGGVSEYYEGGESAFLTWPKEKPAVAAMALYVLAIAVLIFLILLMFGYVQMIKKEGMEEGSGYFGMTGHPYQVSQETPTVQRSWERFAISPAELTPTKTATFDGTDTVGSFRLGKSGAKYYAVKDAQGNYALDKDGYLIFVSLDTASGSIGQDSTLANLRTNFSDPAVRANYAATCNVANLTNELDAQGNPTGISNPWAWMQAQYLSGKEPESFSAGKASQDDQKLMAVNQGYN